MAIERYWAPIAPRNFTSNGTKYGVIELASVEDLKVKQKIFVKSNTQVPIKLEIKSVPDATHIIVGPISPDMEATSDLTGFLVSDGATVSLPEKAPRNPIPTDVIFRSAYDEEPTVALRTILINSLGERYGSSNPLPVEVSGIVIDNINVKLTAKDNYDPPDTEHDSVRIGDGTNEVKVNTDGSLNVVIMSGSSDTVISNYNGVSSVANGILTDVLTYTVPSGVLTFLNKIDYSGENVAQFTIELNGSTIDTQRTYFGSTLNGTFDFANGTKGLPLSVGDVVKLRVIHHRPSTADFSGRIQVVES